MTARKAALNAPLDCKLFAAPVSTDGDVVEGEAAEPAPLPLPLPLPLPPEAAGGAAEVT